MGNYENLKQSVSAVIKTNGNQEITGSILQNVLLTIISTVGANATFAGVATPSTNPGTPDGPVFWIATESGTYSNFGSIELQDGLSVLMWNGSWSSQQIFGVDDVPTAGSDNLVKSGGVQEELALGAVYDVSAKNPTAGPNNDGKFESLSTLLRDTNLNTLIPISVRKGGMSIKFVQSSDNNYVQARCMAQNFTTDTTQWAIADEGVYEENPEFVYVKTDADGKILWAIKTDGGIYYGAGVPQQVIDYIEEKISSLSLDEYEDIVAFLSDYLGSNTTLKSMIDSINERIPEIIENLEFAEVHTDADDKILYGVKRDGDFYFGAGVPSQIQEELDNKVENKVDKEEGKSLIDTEYASSQSTVDSPEHIEVTTDAEGKILAGRTHDGAAFEKVGFSTPKASIGGHTMRNIEDKEGRSEITIDAEDRIISYRDSDGVKHEEVGIKLSKEGLSDLAKDIKTVGVGIMNWSDAKELHIAEPYCATVNFTGIDNIPQAKGVNLHGYMQFWDMNGNYFKKEVIMNAQGSSSLSHPKKNIAIDICNNNGWNDDDTFSLQIGNWVHQDSFHLKGFYNDPFRGLCPVAYKWYDQIVKTRGEFNDYIWKRALIDIDSITPTSNGSTTAKDTEAQYNTGARCFPDGFPCIVYLNGKFYGIYSWQLKKHRDNYHMDKKNKKNIHLDGVIGDATLFNGNIDWTQFEVRNPKDLIDMSGNKYDGDNPTELIDSSSEYYDADNSKHVNTATVKQYIENMVNIKTAVNNAYTAYKASGKTAQDIEVFKAVYETYFDVDNLIDYVIFSDVSNNYDGFNKNWQWLTYDSIKWYIGTYDTDGVFGGFFQLNDTIVPPLTNHLTIEKQSVASIGADWVLSPIYDVYLNELESRYTQLRQMKIIDTNNIVSLVSDWLDRIGNKTTFDKEWEKWPGFIKNDSIHRLYKWVEISISNMDSLYNYNNN